MDERLNKRQILLLACAAITAGSLIVSNIITNKQFAIPFFGFAVTCGVLCIPLSYIVDDVLAEVFGFKAARAVILAGFSIAAIAVVYFQAAIAIPGLESFTAQSAFETVLGATARTTAASFTAYVVGSLLNAKIMQLMHERDGERGLFARCLLSTVAGELVDVAIFAALAFTGTLPFEIIVQIIVCNGLGKCLVEAVCFPLTKRAIKWAKTLE